MGQLNPVGKIPKKSAILSKIHSYTLLFRRWFVVK